MGAAETKLAYRKSVFRLSEETNIPADNDAFWNQFWTVPDSADDVFALVTAADIRRIRDKAPRNFVTLIEKSIDRMYRIINAPGYPSPAHSIEELLNCIRLLTRLLPFVFEVGHSGDSTGGSLEDRLFWTAPAASPESTNTKSAKLLPSERLIITAVDLLFLKDFTLPRSEATSQSRVNYFIWERGIAKSADDIAVPGEMLGRRVEALRFLLCLLSSVMYIPPDVAQKEHRWLQALLAHTDKKGILALLCTLLNTVANYGSGRWNIPYNHIMFQDRQQQVAGLSAQVLLALLDYPKSLPGAPSLPISPTASTFSHSETREDTNATDEFGRRQRRQTLTNSQDSPSVSRRLSTVSTHSAVSSTRELLPGTGNIFGTYLAKLHRTPDLQYLLDELYRIISQPLKARNSYLPNSSRPVTFQLEAIMLLWYLYMHNQKFREHVHGANIADLSIAIIYTALSCKLDPSQIGLVRLCICVLHTFSAEATFGTALQRVFVDETNLPAVARIPSFAGTYADYLIISLNTLITSTRHTLSSLYEPMLITLFNLSPYFTNISVLAAQKLVQLFTVFASPVILLADRDNHRLLTLMAETLDNIIHFNFQDNSNVVYALVRAHKKIRLLKDFTLAQATGRNRSTSVLSTASRSGILGDGEEAGEDATATVIPVAVTEMPPTAILPMRQLSSITHEKSSESSANTESPTAESVPSTPVAPRTPVTPARVTFLPTEDWVSSWHPHLKIHRLLAVLDIAVPRIDELCQSSSLTSDQEILALLRSNELLSALPASISIHRSVSEAAQEKAPESDEPTPARPFRWTVYVTQWFRSLLWGHVYVTSRTPLDIWQGTAIQLFQVKPAA